MSISPTTAPPPPKVFRWRQYAVDSPMMKNHTATWFEDSLYVFGGFDGSHNSNYVRRLRPQAAAAAEDWTVVERQAPGVGSFVPQGRNGHSATLVSKNRILYIGGWLGMGPLGSAEVHVFDLNTLAWSRLETTGQQPGPCNMHTANYIANKVYLFRGGDGQIYLNDLHILDLDTNEWTNHHANRSSRPPPVRANHSSCTCGTDLYIFGGWNGQERLNDLHVLDTRTMVWREVECKGLLPTARAGSTLNCLFERSSSAEEMDGEEEDPVLVLFGGSGALSACFNDLHCFHIRTSTWTRVAPDSSSSSSSSTEPLAAAAASPPLPQQQQPQQDDQPPQLPPSHEEEETAPRYVQQGEPPEKRAGHTATLVCGGRKLVVVGGSFGPDYRRTVFELDLAPVPDFPLAKPHSVRAFEFAQGMASQFDQPEFADVCFLLEEGDAATTTRRIYAHRVVLCARNEYFRVLFSRGFRESRQSEIPIRGVPYEPFRDVVKFLYMMDQVEGDDSSVGEGDDRALNRLQNLYVAADQFMCLELKQQCERELSRLVRRTNLSAVYDFAVAHGASVLAEFCLHFERWGGGS